MYIQGFKKKLYEISMIIMFFINIYFIESHCELFVKEILEITNVLVQFSYLMYVLKYGFFFKFLVGRLDSSFEFCFDECFCYACISFWVDLNKDVFWLKQKILCLIRVQLELCRILRSTINVISRWYQLCINYWTWFLQLVFYERFFYKYKIAFESLVRASTQET